jgi:diaminopimelate decarboxylase
MSRQPITRKISWQSLHRLEQAYGDSFYLLDLGTFQDNYYEFLEAFRSIYPNSSIAYSYKTNYIPQLCQCVNNMGGYAEVVSGMEYDLALRVGVPPQRIIFNGPYKREAEIAKALLEGSIVNLDSQYEVSIVDAIAQRAPERTITVGVRCNFDIGAESISRFGFDVEGKGLQTVFETLRRLENCRVGGLQCHFLTPQKSVESYARLARKMLELSALYFENDHPQFIDLGGGFFSRMSLDLRNQFSFHVPTYEEYAQAIAPQFADIFPDDSGPELILEPGIAITADVMKFVAKVIDIKQIRSRTIALVSGSVYNIKPTLNDKNLPIHVLSGATRSKRNNGPADIVGYTCMEHDCLYKGYEGPLATGDYVVFENVGAYTIVLKPPFILPCPAILAYDANSEEFELVKRQERFSDIFSSYVFN